MLYALYSGIPEDTIKLSSHSGCTLWPFDLITLRLPLVWARGGNKLIWWLFWVAYLKKINYLKYSYIVIVLVLLACLRPILVFFITIFLVYVDLIDYFPLKFFCIHIRTSLLFINLSCSLILFLNRANYMSWSICRSLLLQFQMTS